MSYRIEVRDLASAEFIEGYLWYEQQRDGLGALELLLAFSLREGRASSP